MKYWMWIIGLLTVGACSGPTKKIHSEMYTKGYGGVLQSKVSAKECSKSKQKFQGMSWSRLMEQANACVATKNWEEVERIGNYLAQEHSQSPWGSYYLSLVAEEKGAWSRALWMIELAIKKAPEHGLLEYQKARISWLQGDYSRAIEGMKSALNKDRHLEAAHLQLGRIYFQERKDSEAIFHYRAVISLSPEHQESVFVLGRLYARNGDVESALSSFRKAIRLSANDSKDDSERMRLAQFHLAQLLEEEEKDFRSALAIYKELREKLNKMTYQNVNLDQKIISLTELAKQNSARTPAQSLKGGKS